MNVCRAYGAAVIVCVTSERRVLKYGEADDIRSQDSHDVGRVRATLARQHALCSNLLRLLAYPVSLRSSRHTTDQLGRLRVSLSFRLRSPASGFGSNSRNDIALSFVRLSESCAFTSFKIMHGALSVTFVQCSQPRFQLLYPASFFS